MYESPASDRRIQSMYVSAAEPNARLSLRKIEQLVLLAEKHTSRQLNSSEPHCIKNRKYLQIRHLYPLLHRLEDVRWAGHTHGQTRKDFMYRYGHFHARIASCIIRLSDKSRFRKLKNLLEEFEMMDSNDSHSLYDHHGALQTEKSMNLIYLVFSPYTKSCYIGETERYERIAEHVS